MSSRGPRAGGGREVPGGIRILDRLRHEGWLGQAQYDSVLSHAQRHGERIEDALLSAGVMNESELLRYLAGVYRTRFVSTRKLARATVDRGVLELVPRKLAVRLLLFPVLFDRDKQTLAVVTIDLDLQDVAKQVQMVTGVSHVQTLVARPSAIRAAIRKHYDGDPRGFASVSGEEQASVYERESHTGPESTLGFGNLDRRQAGEHAPGVEAGSGGTRRAVEGVSVPPPDAAEPSEQDELVVSAPGSGSASGGASGPGDDASAAESSQPAGSSHPASPTPAGPAEVSWTDHLETINVLVTLLEQERGELRGHSAMVARGCRKMCDRLDLPPAQSHAIVAAGYLHDVGKTSTYHLTALNVGTYEGHRVQAEKARLAPLRMLEAVQLPAETVRTLQYLYERIDGQGFPERLKGKQIPVGARVLVIVETYADLTRHSKNPYRARLSPQQACDALREYADQLFDSDLLEVFRREMLGDDLKARLLHDRRTVLVVDPDPEETTVLEMRLTEHGYDVAVARNANDALQRFQRGDVDVVVSEVELSPMDGFGFVESLSPGEQVPVVFLTRRGDRESVARGFDLGAADYMVKPASPEVVAAKIHQMMEGRQTAQPRQGGRGVTGSLREMSLPDVIQILANGRKSGRLVVRSSGRDGEVHFGEGAVYDARFGDQQGQEAFYAMLKLDDGEFELDPAFQPTERVIEASAESLLLEGMRRLDEGA